MLDYTKRKLDAKTLIEGAIDDWKKSRYPNGEEYLRDMVAKMTLAAELLESSTKAEAITCS